MLFAGSAIGSGGVPPGGEAGRYFRNWDRLALLGMGPAASPAGAAAAAGSIAKIRPSFPGLVTFFNTFVLSFSGNPDAGRK